jgi:hypothetical protein
VLEVAVFASQYSHRIEERNLFYLMPLFLIALLAWIERGQPRPPRAAIAAAGVAAALPGAIPFLSLLNITAQSDTIGLQPWWYIGDGLAGRNSVAVVVVLISLALGAAFLWLSPRYAPVLPILVALGFLATWLPLQLWTHSFPRLADSTYRQGVGAQRSWIDAAVGRDAHVALLWTGGNDLSAWENEFWNRSIDRVYHVGTPLPGDMPSTSVKVDPATGVLQDSAGRPISAPYVLTDTSVELRGTRIASDPSKQLVLYKVTPPARTTTQVVGLYAEPSSPWSSGHVRWRKYDCTGGTLLAQLRSDNQLFQKPQTVVITGTTPAQRFTIAPGASRTLRLPLAPRRTVCQVDFSISPTHRPVDFPALKNDDTRSLGLHFDVLRYVHPQP